MSPSTSHLYRTTTMQASLRRLLRIARGQETLKHMPTTTATLTRIYPGHGAVIDDTKVSNIDRSKE